MKFSLHYTNFARLAPVQLQQKSFIIKYESLNFFNLFQCSWLYLIDFMNSIIEP